MKTLILMRHAKSSWKDHNLEDIDRPLKKRGKKDAQIIGKIIVDKELVPQTIYCSPAKRSQRTAEVLLEELKQEIPVETVDKLYMAEVPVFYELIKSLPEDLERVMIIGHNPGLESLVQLLSGQIESLPTSALANVSLAIKNWKDLDPETKGELVDLYKPKHDKDK
ncbi:MAG: histidine phosphatase family protein [Anaerolineae bacterium]|nr:histidine phosphatase family protein [Anaerolineae bacterium]